MNDISYNDIYIYYNTYIVLSMHGLSIYDSYQTNAGWLGGALLLRSAERLASHHRSVLRNHLGGWPLGSRQCEIPFLLWEKCGKTRYTMAWQTMGTMGSIVNGGL